MIRRNLPLTEEPEKWLLISQVEHARVSAELAAQWRVGSSPISDTSIPEPVRTELLAAILHHDDGWAHWEADPAIDPSTGRPYSFMELPREQSLPLWHDSILRARQHGPLAGWAVAGHFVRLLVDSDDAELDVSQAWLAEVSNWRQSWLNEWNADNRQLHTVTLAGQCLDWVRTFDWVSLWLCCKCPATPADELCEPMTVDEGMVPGAPVTFTPTEQQADREPRTVTVAPWPFTEPTLAIDALGYAVKAKEYQSSDGLAKNRSPVRLKWRLVKS